MGQVYIEDYVVSFLKQKKTEATEEPVKLALFGTADQPESDITHYIYGAAVLEDDRTIQEIGEEYFPNHQFLGYVNIRNNSGESISRYHIFYDENHEMQDYLLFHYMSPYSTYRRTSSPPKEEINLKPQRKFFFMNKLKLFILGAMCLIIATGVSIIDDYQKMSDFVEITKIVINFEK